MGTGASAGIQAAVHTAKPEELASIFEGMDADGCEKLTAAFQMAMERRKRESEKKDLVEEGARRSVAQTKEENENKPDEQKWVDGMPQPRVVTRTEEARAAAESTHRDALVHEQKTWTDQPAVLEQMVQKKRADTDKLSVVVTALGGTVMDFTMNVGDTIRNLKRVVAALKCASIPEAANTRDPTLWVRVTLLREDVECRDTERVRDLANGGNQLSLQCVVENETEPPWRVGTHGEAYRREVAGDNNQGRLLGIKSRASDEKSGYVPSAAVRAMDEIYEQSW